MDAVTDAFNAIIQSWQTVAAGPFIGGNQPFAPRRGIPATSLHVCSVPGAFSLFDGGPTTVTFAIPAGVYVSAVWDKTSDLDHISQVFCNSHGATFPNGLSASVAATSFQLTDINAAAGSTLTVDYSDNLAGTTENVSAFCLTLTAASIDNPPFGWRPWVHPVIRTWDAPAASRQVYYARPALAIGVPAPVDNPPFGLQSGNCGLRIAVLGNGPSPPLPARPFWIVQPGVPPPVDNPPLGWMRVNIAASIRSWDAAPPLPWHPNWLSEPKAVDPGYDIWEVYSDDNGLTWGVAVMAIPNGKYPTIAVGNDGTIVRAAWVGSLIKCTVQRPGDVNQSSLITFKDNTGADLLFTDERFHIQQGREGPDRWLLHCLAAGDTGTSDWYSSDLGASITSATWTKIL